MGYFNELRKLRNRIDYHGVKVSAETWKANKLKLAIVVRTLRQYLMKELKM